MSRAASGREPRPVRSGPAIESGISKAPGAGPSMRPVIDGLALSGMHLDGVLEAARTPPSRYKKTALSPEAIARATAYAMEQPAEVNVSEISSSRGQPLSRGRTKRHVGATDHRIVAANRTEPNHVP